MLHDRVDFYLLRVQNCAKFHKEKNIEKSVYNIRRLYKRLLMDIKILILSFKNQNNNYFLYCLAKVFDFKRYGYRN